MEKWSEEIYSFVKKVLKGLTARFAELVGMLHSMGHTHSLNGMRMTE